jgi:hypothetical protein
MSLVRFRSCTASSSVNALRLFNLLLPASQSSVIPITVGRNITCNHHIGLVSLAVHVGESTMEHVIQVELRTDTTHTLTWLDANLKPKPGMVLLCKDDPRPWTVVHAYNITAQEGNTTHEDWKVGR